MTALLAGAEPWAVDGGPVGALCLHGFTGNPSALRPVAEAFAAAGFGVELPRLPGHGTSVEDLLTTTWADWTAEVEAAYQRLAARSERVVVAGLSMGGTLALWLAARHREVAGIVCVNPGAAPQEPDAVEMVRAMVAEGELTMPGGAPDIADPDVDESAYRTVALPPLLSLLDAVDALQADLPKVTCPVLLITSTQDHVVDPSASDHVAGLVEGSVERLWLDRSYHVATLDYDRDRICAAAVEFARAVTGGPRAHR
jgi:carboxylesterase